MAKSLGNFKTARDILAYYPGKVVRYFLMSNHYRKPVNFSDDELRMCEKALARLEDAVANAIFAASIDPDEIGEIGMAGDDTRLDAAVIEARRRFENSMDDDFNTAGAIASLHDLATALNTYAVSYTHLDVYKRQPPHSPSPRRSSSSGIKG